ncbi:hypothetical protein CA267_017180 [Alteromonas pelagimontana]|uniref:Uncharacterized protein n=1 Tax=Alteromonas pelagimontana TaxID=1858656 RepID=A0A6M4MGW6_9ALTE|nr:hypothetical protein [Alteromonas pelagimontana]QJR82359.1 hypothetical protein CA267_017180 [Alteromonas pelagimontana]
MLQQSHQGRFDGVSDKELLPIFTADGFSLIHAVALDKMMLFSPYRSINQLSIKMCHIIEIDTCQGLRPMYNTHHLEGM